MMNTGGEGVTEFINAEIEAENDAHFSSSAEDNSGDSEQEYRKVKRMKTDSRMAGSLSELGEERTQVSITSLPQELIAMIFSHLEAHFLCTTVTHVCRYFHNVLKSEWFWKSRKTLYINEEESGIDFIYTVIPKCPNIRHLNVNFYWFRGSEVSLTIPNMSFPRLRSLVMTDIDYRGEDAVEMIVQGAPYLRVIKLDGTVTERMLEVTSQAKELTTFSVDSVNDDDCERKLMLTNIFKSCCKLETVYVYLRNNIDVGVLLTLLEVCSGTLKRLSWSGSLSDLVVEKLSTCLQVSHLEIKNKGMTNESVKFFRHMKQIETLRFAYKSDDTLTLTSDDYIEMFKDNAFPLLKHLSFQSCEEVDDTVLEFIAPNLKNLESLNLSNRYVTNLGIRFMLPHCSNLRALRLSISYTKYSFVKDLPISCPHLHFLVLLNVTPVPEPIIQEFLNTHPSYNIKKCEELTDLKFRDLHTIDLSDISLKPIVVYQGDNKVRHIIGHK